VLEQNKSSVVEIQGNYEEDFTGGGTGIVWQDGNHVLTNAHVVIGASALKIVDPNDKNRTYPAKVVALSACDDVALLEVDRASGLKPAKFGDSTKVQVGDHLIVVGFPVTSSQAASDVVVTEGNVSRLNTTFPGGSQRDLIQHTAPTNPGNSGGPVFDSSGRVVGMHSYGVKSRQGENYAIAISEALTVTARLKEGKNLDYIGVSLELNDAEYAREWDLPYIDGLVVVGVDPGSPADSAKPYPLDTGYLIFEVNGTYVRSLGDFCDIIRSKRSGDTLRIRFGAYDEDGDPYNNYVNDVVLP
jgi:serine protease Do